MVPPPRLSTAGPTGRFHRTRTWWVGIEVIRAIFCSEVYICSGDCELTEVLDLDCIRDPCRPAAPGPADRDRNVRLRARGRTRVGETRVAVEPR